MTLPVADATTWEPGDEYYWVMLNRYRDWPTVHLRIELNAQRALAPLRRSAFVRRSAAEAIEDILRDRGLPIRPVPKIRA